MQDARRTQADPDDPRRTRAQLRVEAALEWLWQSVGTERLEQLGSELEAEAAGLPVAERRGRAA